MAALTILQLFELWLLRVDPATQRTRLVQLWGLLSAGEKTATLAALKTDLLAVLTPEDTALDAQIADVNASTGS